MSLSKLNSISGRLSLRTPQRESLEALKRAIDVTNEDLLNPDHDVNAIMETLKGEFATLEDFERDFPSLCFALATGVGKTRLMGAFISYLYLTHNIKNFFVLAPNLTIYEKLIADFTPNTPKYVFKGISEFYLNAPLVITGDNYEQKGSQIAADLFGSQVSVVINVFNISKINSEVRGGKAPRIKRLSEYLGDSYFAYLAKLPDLVLLMDESHRYRASAGVKAINELKPILGLELTATPFVEGPNKPVPFKNVVVDYPLSRAMDDGFVKEPAVVTQKNFDPSKFKTPEEKQQLETIKLMDGIRLHEATKVELFTYAHENSVPVVKPFMLVIARDTTHAAELYTKLEEVYDCKYKGKVIQVDSSRTGAEEEEMIRRLLAVESKNEPTEIVIHVNMLKEGWDVTNLYTIVPLRAANARTLIEQSIGRGLRLPYGKRTKVEAVDRLSIVAHDRFQEIVDEANNPENPLRLKTLILDRPEDDTVKTSVQVNSGIDAAISGVDYTTSSGQTHHAKSPSFVYKSDQERKVAAVAAKIIQSYQHRPHDVPTSGALNRADVQKAIADKVSEEVKAEQLGLKLTGQEVDIDEVVRKTTELIMRQTIDIPRVIVIPKGEITTGYRPFQLDLSAIKGLKPQTRSLISQSLENNKQTVIGDGDTGNIEPVKENYILKKLFNFDDIDYDSHTDLLHDLSKQAVDCLLGENDDADVENILQNQADRIAKLIHAQLDNHFFEDATEYEINVSRGFTPLKDCAYTIEEGQAVQDVRSTISDPKKIKQMLFGNFQKCLYPVQKFDSDTERRFAVLLERDSIKWFKPAKGQFKMYYKAGSEHPEYVPDFVAELDTCVLMIETKSKQHQNVDGSWSEEVTEKAKAGKKWCESASQYLLQHGGKNWKYLLIPHDEVKENFDMSSYVNRFEV